MNPITYLITKLYVDASYGIQHFKNSERGDTNFIAIAIIVGIIIVLAGVFLLFGESIMESIIKAVKDLLVKMDIKWVEAE